MSTALAPVNRQWVNSRTKTTHGASYIEWCVEAIAKGKARGLGSHKGAAPPHLPRVALPCLSFCPSTWRLSSVLSRLAGPNAVLHAVSHATFFFLPGDARRTYSSPTQVKGINFMKVSLLSPAPCSFGKIERIMGGAYSGGLKIRPSRGSHPHASCFPASNFRDIIFENYEGYREGV